MKTYTLDFDLDTHMQSASGKLVFSETGEITSFVGDEPVFSVQAADIEETAVIAGVGCGFLHARMKDGGERLLCRFTMSVLKPAGEFCKVINFYVKTGQCALPEREEKPVCEKCGNPYMEGMNVCLFCYNKMGVIQRTFQLMRPFTKKIVMAELLLALSSALYLLVPLFNRILIDRHLRPMTGTAAQIILLVGAMFLARAMGEVIFILSSRAYNKASIAFATHLRNLTYDKIQKLSMRSLSKHTPGDLIRRVTEDTNTIKDFMADGGRWAIEQFLIFIIVLVILLCTNWRLTLLVFLPVPVVMVLLSRFWRVIILKYERQWRKNAKCQSILHDIIKGIRTVKAFGKEDREIQKFSSATRELAEVSSDNEALWARLFPLMMLFTGIGEFLVLYFGGRSIIGGNLSFGVLVQFTMYVGYIYGPLRWMVSFPRWLADALTSMIKVFEILDEDLEIAATENPKNIPLSGGVSFEGVSFGYKTYEPVLKGITIDIRPGEMIGIVGRSGAGKSTMINLLMRLYDPSQGRICINGTDIRDISPTYLHQNVGVVFQDTFLFAGTFYDNIAYAKPDATPAEVLAAAKAANAHDFIMQTADGYNTLIGESGYSISGGERQRLSIARAIIKNPDILILDEATSSLDVETESIIQASLNRLIQGRTTIAIAHRLSTLRSADRLIVLDDGKIAEAGTHIELLRKKGIYYRLVIAQRQTSKIVD